MAAFKIFVVFSIVCLTLAAGGNHRSFSRIGDVNSFQCPSEGFHPDPNDCRIFYRCVDWNSNVFFRDYNEPSLTPFQFTCGEGTVFDPEYNICNHPDQTLRKDCAGRGGNDGGTSSSQYPFTYPPSMENYPTEGGYPVYPTYEVNTNDPDSYPNEYQNQISPDGEMMETSPGVCSGEGFFPVPGDCNRFMRCTEDGMGGYRKFVFRCGEGTVWDQQNLVCNHPGSVPGCGGNQSGDGNGQYPDQGGDGNPLEYPQGAYPGDNHQGNRPDQSGYPQENHPNPGGYPVQQGNQLEESGYPETQGNQGGYPETGLRPPPENQGYPGQQQGNRPDQSSYPSQGYPGQQNQGGYPEPDNQNQGNPQQQQSTRPPTNQQNRPGQSGYPQQGGYPNQQNQGGYPTPGNRPPPQNQGSRPPTNQGNRPDQPEYPQQGGYPGQQNQGGYPTPGNRPPAQNQGNPQQGGYPGQQNQGGYPSPGNQLPAQNQGYPQQGSRPPTNQQNQGNQPGYPQQTGYPGQQNQGGYPSSGNQQPGNNQEYLQLQQGSRPTNQQNQGNGYPQQGGYPGQNGLQNRPGNQNYGPNQQGGYPQQPGNPQEQPNQPGYPQQGGYPNEPAQSYPQQGQPGQGYQPESSPGGNPNQPSMGNSNECQGDGFFSVPGDCVKFYRCVDNGKGGYMRYDFTCGPNTVWDQEMTTCNHPWAVQRNDCSNPTGSDLNSGSSPDKQQPDFGQTPSESTPANPNQQSPSNQNQIPTQPTPSQQSPSSQMSTQPTPSQQTPFNQIPTQTPPTTLHQQTTQLPDSQTIQSTTEGSQDGSTTPSNQPDAPQGSRPCQPDQNQPVKCEKAGFYPVPGNCKKFYRCADWDGEKGERFSVYFFECGEGTIWDPALQTCNHEESVYPPRDCSGGQSNQTTSAPTTTVQTTPTTTAPTTPKPELESTTSEGTDATPQEESASSKPVESTPQSTESMTTMEMTTERQETTSEQSETTEPGNPSTQAGSNPTEPATSSPTETGETDQTEPTTDEEDKNSQTNRPDTGDSNPDCPALENGQVAFVCPTGFRRHPKDCNLFYQCTISKAGEINVMSFTCKNESVYDERKIQCLPPDETDPCPSRRRYTRSVEPEMTSVVPIASSKSLCPREGHFPYDGDCPMFFKCKKDDRGRMQGYLYQCQPKHAFSPASGRCERSSTIQKCARASQYLTATNLKWMTSKVPIEYFDVR